MSAYLIDHPPATRQFRDRGTTPSGVIVIHTAENTPDTDGADGSAEAVAGFIARRSDYGSYHYLADSDSIVHLVPLHAQAYGDGTGSNPHAIHVSGATQAARWATLPQARRRAIVVNMAKAAARAARWLENQHGVTVPARRITKAQSDNRQPGFIAHGDRDPGRRTDPGPGFPWELFLATFRDLMDPKPEPQPNRWDDLIAQARDLRKALPDDAAARRADLAKIVDLAAPWSIANRPEDKD